MFEVIVYRQAKADIARDAIWWADNRSLDQALRWIDAVELQLQSLAEFPDRFGFAPENGLFVYEIRQAPVGLGDRRTHRAIYSIRGRRLLHSCFSTSTELRLKPYLESFESHYCGCDRRSGKTTHC